MTGFLEVRLIDIGTISREYQTKPAFALKFYLGLSEQDFFFFADCLAVYSIVIAVRNWWC